MRISIPVTSSAKKQSVVIQCVARTTAVCRGVLVATETPEAKLGIEAELATQVC